ncbi:MAG: hypothetical protein QOH63_3704 [Acidobacteriota bacterium]|jgi:hypothetical protein|nr:hypothetical protein [Acidobacteriota bacterium]
MYCPKCAAQNIEDAQFCRGCGENISLVSQAMTGQLPEKRAVGHDAEDHPYDEIARRFRRAKDTPRLDKAIKSGFMGLAFLIIAIILGFTGDRRHEYWYWLLIPAFTMLGGGVAEYVRVKQGRGTEKRLPDIKSSASMPPAPERMSALPPRNTSELVPQPPSVTESTTRHLDLSTEAPTRNISRNDE